MTTMRTKCLVVPLCGFLAASVFFGCEDADSRQRLEVQTAIMEATATYRAASLRGSVTPDDPEYAEVKRKLDTVVSEMSRLSGGAPGQQAAKELLIAESLRELAMPLFSQAATAEAENRLQRGLVQTQLAGMLRLEEQAAAVAQLSAQAQRVAIGERREQLERSIDELERRIADLESPIGDLAQANTVDTRAVDQIREQADELLREAMDLGHADGFHSYEESIALRRQADQIEYRMAQREIELTLELQPERDLAQRQAEQNQAMLQAARLTLRELDEIERGYRDDATRLREASAELARKIREATDALVASPAEIEPLYEQAAAHLERASNAASRAAGMLRGASDSARLTEARCRELLGRVYWTEATGLSDQVALLESLIAAGEAIGNVSVYRAQVETLKAQAAERMTLAQAAYAAAQSAVGQVSGAVQGRDSFQAGLQSAIVRLTGEAIAPPGMPEMPEMPEFDADASGFPIDPSMAQAMDEPMEPEGLIAFLDQMEFDMVLQSLPPGVSADDPQMMETLQRAFNQSKPAVRMQIQRGEVTTLAELIEAFQQAMMQRMMGG